jgi:hypothetical protein
VINCAYHDCKNAISKCSMCKHNGASTQLDFYEVTKLPNAVDKKGRSNYKNGIRAERVVANKFGGKVVPASGALSYISAGLGGDVVFPDVNVLAQVTTRSKRGDDVIRIQKSWILKHWQQSSDAGRIPVLIFSFYSKERFWAVCLDTETTDTVGIHTAPKNSFKVTREMLNGCPIYFWFKDDWQAYKIVPCEDFFESVKCQTE